MNARHAGISTLRVVCRSRFILRRKPRLIFVAQMARGYSSSPRKVSTTFSSGCDFLNRRQSGPLTVTGMPPAANLYMESARSSS
jgi:hypothetical protein